MVRLFRSHHVRVRSPPRGKRLRCIISIIIAIIKSRQVLVPIRCFNSTLSINNIKQCTFSIVHDASDMQPSSRRRWIDRAEERQWQTDNRNYERSRNTIKFNRAYENMTQIEHESNAFLY